MTNSPFAQSGASIWENGYTPIPLLPGDKRPGQWKGQGTGWVGMPNWSQFQDEPVAQWRLDQWIDWPDANIGVIHGRDFIGIDFDNDPVGAHPAIKEILAELEGDVVRRVGQKGYIQYFRCDGDVETAVYKVDRQNILEVLGAGRQSVLPPSIHPTTKKPYTWLTDDTLEDTELGKLPLLDAGTIERIKAVLREHGWDERSYSQEGREVADGVDAGGNSIDRELNLRALANIGKWFPELGLAKSQPKANDGWEAVPEWRGSGSGNPIEKRKRSLKVDPTGIVDFGAGASYTPIDLVMVASNCTFDQAWSWLHERVGKKYAPWAGTSGKSKSVTPDQVPVVAAKQEKEFTEELNKGLDKLSIPAAGSMNPYDLRNAPGIIGATANFCLNRSMRPAPEYALMAGLATACTLFSRKFETHTRSGLNLYMVMIGKSGYGKDMPLRIPVDVMASVGNGERFLGGSDVTSDSALELMLRRNPIKLLALDEIGMLISNMQGQGAANWERRIKKAVLELYGKSSSIWMGKATASVQDEEKEKIVKPCLSIIGATTPSELFDGLSEANMKDGLMARMIFTSLDERPEPGQVGFSSDVPEDLRKMVIACQDVMPGEGNLQASHVYGSTFNIKSRAVPFADGAAEELWQSTVEWSYKVEDEGIMPGGLINRTAENILRVATVRALARDYGQALVTCSDIAWGSAIIERSHKMMFAAIQRYMFRSNNEKAMNDMMESIAELNKKAKGEPVTLSQISRACRNLPRRMIEEFLERLIDEGDIIESIGDEGKVKKKKYLVVSRGLTED